MHPRGPVQLRCVLLVVRSKGLDPEAMVMLYALVNACSSARRVLRRGLLWPVGIPRYGNVVIPGWSFEPVVREILANTGVALRKVLETEYGLVEDGTNKKSEAV